MGFGGCVSMRGLVVYGLGSRGPGGGSAIPGDPAYSASWD